MEAYTQTYMETYMEREDLFMPKQKGTHTIEEIYALPEGERAELIDGELYMMATPSAIHQLLVGELFFVITSYIRKRKGLCKVFIAPFAVFPHNDDSTYVEPDISVLCDREKWDNKGCHGAPDWVIEVVSPFSRKMDYVIKLAEYQRAGVREYWIVDPMKKIVMVYMLEQDVAPVIYRFSEKVKVGIYEGLEIDFGEIDLMELE